MISNPKSLKDYILRTLGAPIINVEVTEDQIYDCIQRTLDMFGKYHYDGTNRAYAVYKLSKEEAACGVLDMKDKNVFAVTKIIRASSVMYMTFGGTPYNWFSDLVLGISGVTAGGNSFYSPYSPFSGGMSYFTQLSSYFSLIQDQFDPIPDYWYNEASEQLHISGKQLYEGDAVVCEVYVKSYSDVDKMIGAVVGYGTIDECGPHDHLHKSSYFNPDDGLKPMRIGCTGLENSSGVYDDIWVKEYSTCLVKELNGYILSKHQGMQLPGGVTIDGTRMMDDARQDKLRLEQELYLMDTPIPIIVG